MEVQKTPQKSTHAESPEHSSKIKEQTETLVETNPLAMVVHSLFPMSLRETKSTEAEFEGARFCPNENEFYENIYEETQNVHEETQDVHKEAVENVDVIYKEPQVVSKATQSKPRKQRPSKYDPYLSKAKARFQPKKSKSSQTCGNT